MSQYFRLSAAHGVWGEMTAEYVDDYQQTSIYPHGRSDLGIDVDWMVC